MDVFSQAMQSGGAFLSDAALAAGHEIGVFAALDAGGSMSLDEIAEATGVATGRHRLRALLEVLAALGAVRCERAAIPTPSFAALPSSVMPSSVTPSSVTPSSVPPSSVTPTSTSRFEAVPDPVRHPAIARAGWGLLAEVIRRDQSLAVETGDGLRRLHHHLADAGADAARELADRLGTTSLLDLGAGAGAYSKAFLLAHRGACATLVDTHDVLTLAVERLGPLAERCRFVEGDASTVDAGAGYGAALLANVLHLHSPAMCGRLCAVAARAVAPGGVVVIKDLRVDDDRSGPLEGLLFALNMAIYTEAGSVYATSQLRTWLTEAGLVDVEEHRLAAAPDAVVVIGRRA